MIRIGHGYDVHRLTAGRDLFLGGVRLDHDTGLYGHSDADVLVHAIMDALLGAAAMGDIGMHFPNSDESYRGAFSLDLLRRVAEMLSEKGYGIVNIDSTVIAENPKLSPYTSEMVKNIASACGMDTGSVNVKATTEEGMSFTGAGQGIAAHAVALISD